MDISRDIVRYSFYFHPGVPDGSQLLKSTSSKTFVTYSNRYCAMCHGESVHDLISWSFKLLCTSNLPNVPTSIKMDGNKSLTEIGRYVLIVTSCSM